MTDPKTCPFCGMQPTVEKKVFISNENRGSKPVHDIEVAWEIRCPNCGTGKASAGRTFYSIKRDGAVVIAPQSYLSSYKGNNDKLAELVERWNTRKGETTP